MWKSSFHVSHSDLGFLYETKGRTCRFVIRNNLSGNRIRILFANEASKTPVRIEGAVFEKTDAYGKISECMTPLTFSGSGAVTLKQGESCYCDEASLSVSPGEYLALRIFSPGKCVSGNVVGHYARRSVSGDHCTKPVFPEDCSIPFLFKLAKLSYEAPIPLFKSLEVDTQEPVCVISAFGDSITAGAAWTEPLAQRLYQQFPGQIACGNTGIAGNRLLQDPPKGWDSFGAAGVHRFQKDVLSVAGISHVIFALGTNDIGYPGNIEKKAPMPTVDDFLQAYSTLVQMCKERGIRTIFLPVFPRADAFQSQALEALRQELNERLSKSGLFDYCIAVEDALRDPKGVGCRDEYVLADKFHLNAAGGEIVAQQIDLLKLLGKE